MSATETEILKQKRSIDFPVLWKKAVILSGALLLISVFALAVRGLNLGIDFEGGTSFEVVTESSIEDISSTLPDDVSSDARIQEVIDEDGQRAVRVRSSVEDAARVEEVRAGLSSIGDISAFESVGPTWGSAITGKAINALIWFFLAIAVYISVRLEWKMAIGALVAVTHDIIISVGVYAVFGFEVTPATVIAFLTIMGYSLYDTIVVYDKVREVTARVGATGRYTYTEMMNLALNRVIMRSLNTTITSVLPVLSMLLVGSLLLGAVTLREFGIALLVGLIVGAYSSLFVASWVVAWLKEKEPRHTEVREKLEAKGVLDGTRTVDNDDAVLGTTPRRGAGAKRTSTSVKERPTSEDVAESPRKNVKKAKKTEAADTESPADSDTDLDGDGHGKDSTTASDHEKLSSSDTEPSAKPKPASGTGGSTPPRPRKKKKKR